MKNLTNNQLIEKSRNYDRINNEGGEGYNPYRAELEKREYAAEAARPKSIAEQKSAILHKISVRDCSIARESGTYNQAGIDSLRAELKSLEDEENAKFVAEWTLEETKSRRIDWNNFINAEINGGAMTPEKYRKLHAKTSELGWGLEQLKKAITLHNLGPATR